MKTIFTRAIDLGGDKDLQDFYTYVSYLRDSGELPERFTVRQVRRAFLDNKITSGSIVSVSGKLFNLHVGGYLAVSFENGVGLLWEVLPEPVTRMARGLAFLRIACLIYGEGVSFSTKDVRKYLSLPNYSNTIASYARDHSDLVEKISEGQGKSATYMILSREKVFEAPVHFSTPTDDQTDDQQEDVMKKRVYERLSVIKARATVSQDSVVSEQEEHRSSVTNVSASDYDKALATVLSANQELSQKLQDSREEVLKLSEMVDILRGEKELFLKEIESLKAQLQAKEEKEVAVDSSVWSKFQTLFGANGVPQ